MEDQPIPGLRPNLRFTVHTQNATLWYAAQDPSTGKFVRLGRKEYLIAGCFDGRKTASEVQHTAQAIDPRLRIGEKDTEQVATWLLKLGLLETDRPDELSQAAHKKIVLNPLYTRIPLLSGHLIESSAQWLTALLNRWTAVAAMLLYGVALLCVLMNWDTFSTQAGKLFVADGRLWWIAAWFVLKSAHELGHAVAALKVGSQIRAAGISFIFFAPVPYVDISDLWTISNRWQRILCSAGGMLVEMCIASIAAIVALSTDNESITYLCCATATLGTVTTLAFNANPMVRFDGYFILSDLLNRPNLWSEGQQAAKNFLSRPFNQAARSTPIRPAFVLYGLGCFCYRIGMLLGLAFWAIIVWEGLGIIMVLWGAYATLIAPAMKKRAAAKNRPAEEPSDQTRFEAVLSRLRIPAVTGIIGLLLYVLPSPVQPSAPGVFSLKEPVTLRAETDGFLEEVFFIKGAFVNAGDLLARISNPELQLEYSQKELEAATSEAKVQTLRARGSIAESQAEIAKVESLRTQLAQLREKLEKLEIRAPASGTILQSDLPTQLGKHIVSGEAISLIGDPTSLEITVSVSQHDIKRMRAFVGEQVQVRLADGGVAQGTIEEIDTRCTEKLTAPQLAAIYEGPINVEMQKDETGEDQLKLLAPRFETRIQLNDPNVRRQPGEIAWVRIPGHSANLLDAAARWIEKKWNLTSQFANQDAS